MRLALVLGSITIAAAIVAVAALSAAAGFGLAAILAACWCLWLERHPEGNAADLEQSPAHSIGSSRAP